MSETMIVCRQTEGIEPPACCQWPLDERIARLERAQDRYEDERPRRCSACSSSDLVPTWPPDPPLWACERCGNVFMGRD